MAASVDYADMTTSDSPPRLLRKPAFAVALAVLLGLPSLFLGRLLDDHTALAHTRAGTYLRTGVDTRLFRSVAAMREQGFVGWWAGEDFRVVFMRPLAALSHSLDHLLWPEATWLMHLENLALYALIVAVVARLFRRYFGPGSVAAWATLIFAIDEAHMATTLWISGRNTLLAVLFGSLCLLAHLRWRGLEAEGEAPAGRPRLAGAAALLCFVLALLSAEAGVSCFGFLIGLALIRERGPWSKRLLSLAPYALAIVIWRIVAAALEVGARDSDVYVDPLAAPLEVLAKAVIMTPALGFARLGPPLSADLMTASWAATGLAALGLVILAWAFTPLLRERRQRALALGMLLAAVPFAATLPSGRILICLGVGGSALVGGAIANWRAPIWAPARRLRRGLVGAVIVCNLVLAPLAVYPLMWVSTIMESPHLELEELAPAGEADETVVVLNLPMEINALYPKAIRENRGGRWPEHLYLLYAGLDPATVERVDARSFEIHAPTGWARAPVDRLTRDWDRGFEVGDRVSLERGEIEVLELGEDGRPTRVRARFDRSIDELFVIGLGLDGEPGARRWQPEIGDRAELKPTVGPR